MSQKTAIDSLLEVAELQENDANPRVIVLTNKQNHKTAKIHLLGTIPYWASIGETIPPIERRVVIAGFVAYKERYNQLIRIHPEIRESLQLPVRLTEEFLVDGKIMGKILQESFIYTADRIFNWKDVSYEIKKETTFNADLTKFYFSRTKLPPGKLVEAVTTRHEALARAVEKFPMVNMQAFFKEIKIEQAINNSSIIDLINRDETAIIKSISDLDPLEKTMYRTGMPPVSFVRSLLSLYEKDFIVLSYKGNDVKDMIRNPDQYKNLINDRVGVSMSAGYDSEKKVKAAPLIPSRPRPKNIT